MAVSLASPKAFAVLFKDLPHWNVQGHWLSRINGCQWPMIKLGDLVSVRFEKVPLKEIVNGTMLLLDRVSFEEGRIFAGKRTRTRMTQYRAIAGDIVVSKINAKKKAIGIVPNGKEIGITIHFRALIPHTKKIITEFLWLTLRSEFCRRQFEIDTGGIGKGEISQERLLDVKVPVPLLREQEAIVARWRAAQEAIAKSRENVAKLESEIPVEIYRALGTPHPKSDVHPPKVLALWWGELSRWSFNYLVRSRQGLLGFTRSRYPIRSLAEFLSDTTNGYCVKPVPVPAPHKMLKLNALTPAGLDSEQAKFVKVSERIAERFHICKGDLLICRSVGSYAHVAKCVLVEENRQDLLFLDIVIRIRFSEGILPEFAREVIQTPLGRSYFQSNARTAIGMWKIGAEDIRNFPIPVPPINVQRKIVDMVKGLRQRIADERKVAEGRSVQATREVEEMILGTRPVR